jgi:hypothetical protein
MDKRGGKGLSEKCEATLHTLVREVQVRLLDILVRVAEYESPPPGGDI